MSTSRLRAGALSLPLCLALTAGVFTVAAPASAEGEAVAGGVAFPGPNPGIARAELGGGAFRLTNDVLEQRWTTGAPAPRLTSFVNRIADAEVGVTTSSFVSMTLADGTVIDDDDLTRVGRLTARELDGDDAAPGVAEKSDGVAVDSSYTFTSGGDDYTLSWSAELRDGSNSVEHLMSIGAEGSAPLALTSVSVFGGEAASAYIWGRDDGNPIAFGAEGQELGFVGLESPLSKPVAVDGEVSLSLPLSTPVSESFDLSVGFGVVPQGQLRRAFGYYVERERAHERRTFLHYQSWYDLKPGAPSLVIDREGLDRAIDLFGGELGSRGAQIDSFWVDDGWDYLRDPQLDDESDLQPWDFDPSVFPNGFDRERDKIEAQGAGGSLSVWMSPFGGYGASKAARLDLNASKPEGERLETRSGGFDIGGERYGQRFRDVVFRMMDEFNVKGFKFDGVGAGLGQTGPADGRLGEYEAILALMRDMRDYRSDVFINITVGSWGSPYWLWYTDSVFRDGADVEFAGEGALQTQYVTGRDGAVYDNLVTTEPAFPITSLMVHGFVFSDRSSVEGNKDLTDPTVRYELENDLRNYFANGYSLQELYVRQTLVDPELGVPGADFFWDTLAANAKWGRENQDLLADNHWVSGDPATEAYATAAWAQAQEERGVVQVRNGTAETASYRLDVGDAFELPEGASTRYRLTERDGQVEPVVVDAGRALRIDVEPGQTLLFEATPTDEPATVQLNVSASVTPQDVGGRVTVTGSFTNDEAVAARVAVRTPFGTRSLGTVAPGRTVSYSIDTRLPRIPAGRVSLDVTVELDGAPVTQTITAAWEAFRAGG